MNILRLARSAKLLLAGSASILLGSTVSNAQISRGEFTLPVETHWGGAVIAPGAYSYTLDRATVGFVLALRGQGKLVNIPSTGAVSMGDPFKGSTLLLETEEGQTNVRSVQFGHLGMTVRYPDGSRKKAQ